MKNIRIIVSLLMLCSSLTLSAQEIEKSRQLGSLFSAYVVDKDFTSAYEMFDEVVSSKMDMKTFEQMWGDLNDKLGELKSIGLAKAEKKSGMMIVRSPLHFDKNSLVLQLVFNEKYQIAGVFFMPFKEMEVAGEPSYVDSTKYVETDVKIGKGIFELSARLCKPANISNPPVVILVHGSGPNDMDETIMGAKVFRDLAHGLASNGVAVLRYHKRTFEKPLEMLGSPVNFENEVLEDVKAAISKVKAIEGLSHKKIFVAGHSLGAYLAPEVAKRNPDLAGIIMLAAPARDFEVVIQSQMHYLLNQAGAGRRQAAQLALIDRQVKRIQKRDFDKDTPVDSMLLNMNVEYWNAIIAYDHIKTTQDLELPVFILQGAKDYQVTNDDFELWKRKLKRNKNVSYKLYPGLTHLFTEVVSDGLSKPKDYESPKNVAEQVIIDIANWVLK